MKPPPEGLHARPTYLPHGAKYSGHHTHLAPWRAARTRHARSARASSFSSFFQIDSFVHVRRTHGLVRIDIERYISAPPWTIDRNSRSRPLIARCTQCRPLCAIIPSQASSSPPVRRGAESLHEIARLVRAVRRRRAGTRISQVSRDWRAPHGASCDRARARAGRR